jgi:hypothetical protein
MIERRQGRPNGPRWLALTWIATVACGCGAQETLRDIVLRAAELQKTREAEHAELRSEVARVEQEGGLPLQVGRELPPDEANVATALGVVIDPMLRTGYLERTKALFPIGRFDFTPLELAEARQYLQKHRARIDRFHAALCRGECGFPIDYRLGYFDEPTFVDDVTIACRCLALEVADALAADDVAAALGPLEGMWRLAGWLGRERLLPARLRAAELRAEGLLVVEAVANHPDSRRADLLYLFDVVERQLDDWPPDEACLIGDRAMTLHAYECIRLGLLRWILTSEEKERFRSELNYDSLPDVVEKTVDQDELFYLLAIRRHIESCREPYYLRRTSLVQLGEELNRTRMSQDRSRYPVLAATLFLPGLEEAHASMARDRARCEAFALALAEATGKRRPEYSVNGHHGRPYEVVRESQRVVVQLDEPDERDVVIAIPADAHVE